MPSEFLLIEAAQSEQPRVMGLAYSGGKMNLPGWRYPVVVDLSGLQVPEQVPLLADHRNQTTTRVGMIRARIEDSTLVIEGDITSNGGVATGIVEQAKAGADWQLSIGAEVKDAELVRGSRIVNGQEHTGPFYHIRQSVLREVSVVAVGADSNTCMRIAANFNLTGASNFQSDTNNPDNKEQFTDSFPHTGNASAGHFHVEGDSKMNEFEKWLQENGIKAEGMSTERMAALKAAFEAGDAPPVDDKEEAKVTDVPKPYPAGEPPIPDAADQAKVEAQKAVKAERDRISEIQAVCSGEFHNIEREAISAGWSVDDTRDKVLKAMRAERPQADINISIQKEHTPMDTTRRLEAALCYRAGIDEDALLAAYGEATVSEAYHDRDVSLQQLFVQCANAEGIPVPRHFGNDTIRAAFSTASLPGILNNVANKKLLKSFQAQPIIATRLCSEGELTDFKESERYRLTDVGDLEPVAPDGEIKHGGLSEEKATNQLKTYGKTFTLTRIMIYNDDLNAFLRVPEGMGGRSARKVDQLFFQRLLSNPNSLFSAAHKNYKEGADTVLSADSLAIAIQIFLDQVDADKQPINVNPRYILVPTALKMAARELLNSSFLMSVGSTNKQRIPTYNPLADENLEVVASPYLSNTNYTGASTKAWYLFGDPSVIDTFEIGYLRGRRVPTVEKGDTDFDTLGIKFRVFYDLGVREQDWRGVFKARGE